MLRRALLISAFFAASAFANTAVNQRAATNNERGFAAEKVYLSDDLDSVNLFNGNLTLAIPLGGTYPVSSHLAYGLKLYYNSKVWDPIFGGVSSCHAAQPPSFAAFPAYFPHYGASAGLGWTFSLGHFLPRDQASSGGIDTYLSPDGASHVFGSRQTVSIAGYTAIAYTGDGSNLRLRVTTGGQYEVEFPDGTVHTFGTNGFILRMHDRFNQAVQIQNAIVQGAWIWTLTDAHRTQTVRLTDAWTVLPVAKRFGSIRWIVDSVTLAAFSPDGTAQPTGKYKFEYSYEAVARGCAAGVAYAPCTNFPEVPLLKTLKWEPDGSTYQFEYNTVLSQRCDQGMLRKVTLPTGGSIVWTYSSYELPANGCRDAFGAEDWRNTTTGVVAKTLYGRDGLEVGDWTWTPALGDVTETENICPDVTLPGDETPTQVTHRGYQHVTNTVTDPLDRATVHYFATWDSDVASSSGNAEADYGLPFTRLLPAPSASDRYLSRQVCAAGASPCEVVRSVYVHHDYGAMQRPAPQNAERVVFNDDSANYVDRLSSNHDGRGHYRETLVTSSFGPNRKTVVAWNGTSGIAAFTANAPWLLNRFDAEEVSQTVGGVEETFLTRQCMDPVTGVLNGKQWLRAATPDEFQEYLDVIVRYDHDENGDAVAEDWYGGDNVPLTSFELCDADDAEASGYRMEHAYTAGVRRSTQYRNATFRSFDVTVDARSGLARVDEGPSGTKTTMTYDTLGRVTEVRPADEAWTQYTYDLAANPSNVVVRTFAADELDPSMETALTEQRIYYDGLGRMRQTRDRRPGTEWSVVEYGYDALGQRTSVSVPVSATDGEFAVLTEPSTATFAYDRFGRQTSATAPDGSSVGTMYTGNRQVDRETSIDGTAVTTREEYDAHGRLIKVTENALKPAKVQADYEYDANDRLTRVTMTDGEITQERRFVYDGRGFLRSEFHPELGSAGNGSIRYNDYDARGRARRIFKGTAGATYDLALSYDFAERLKKVEDRNVSGQRRTLKEFVYAPQNTPAACTPGTSGCDATKGRLLEAIRYNDLPDLGTIQVKETYEYTGTGRRPTKRTTTVASTEDFAGASFVVSQSWNALGLPESITYPSTSAVSQPRTVSFDYERGLLTNVTGYASIAYQPNGLVKTVSHGNGVEETWTADPNGMARPATITAGRANETAYWSYGPYSYDGSGNITAIGNWSYSYDALNRLVAWKQTTATGSSTTRRFMDAFGNYLGEQYSGCSAPLQCWTSALQAADMDELTNHDRAEVYDRAGAVVADSLYSYAYDNAGMMNALIGRGRDERYLYTADDERIAIVDRNAGATTWTLRGVDNRLLRTFKRTSISGTTGWSWLEDEIWRGSNLLASESPTGRKHYHLDHLGSPRLVTSATGARLGEQSFTPFGIGGTSDGGRIQFTGHEADNGGETQGLIYAHARYLLGGRGRFLSVDPTWESADLGRPQSWNRYSYTLNNPVNMTDPDGRCSVCVVTPTINWSEATLPPEMQELRADILKATAFALIAIATGGEIFDSEPANRIDGEIVIDGNKYPEAARHIDDAQAAGKPSVITVDRQGASKRRREATRGTPTLPGADRDEYPPAVAREGGKDSSVRHIPPADNRGAGASMGQQLKKFKDDAKVVIRTIWNAIF